MLNGSLVLHGRYSNIWKIPHEPVNEIGICILYFCTRPKALAIEIVVPELRTIKITVEIKLKKKTKQRQHTLLPSQQIQIFSHCLVLLYSNNNFIYWTLYSVFCYLCYKLEESIISHKYLQMQHAFISFQLLKTYNKQGKQQLYCSNTLHCSMLISPVLFTPCTNQSNLTVAHSLCLKFLI